MKLEPYTRSLDRPDEKVDSLVYEIDTIVEDTQRHFTAVSGEYNKLQAELA